MCWYISYCCSRVSSLLGCPPTAAIRDGRPPIRVELAPEARDGFRRL